MSATCEEIKPLLTDYAMQEIGKADAESVHKHLGSCTGCRHELDETLAMFGLLQRAEVKEDIPRHIRVVAQPAAGVVTNHAGWWSSLWNNAGRLAFAGGALACLAVGLLGIFQASVSYGAGGFQVAFGVPSPAAVATPETMAASPETAPVVMPVAAGNQLSKAEVEALIAQASQASELRQKGGISDLVRNASLAADERRSADLQQMAETFRYMQAAQTNMWKEQVQSQQIVAVLAQKNGLNLSE